MGDGRTTCAGAPKQSQPIIGHLYALYHISPDSAHRTKPSSMSATSTDESAARSAWARGSDRHIGSATRVTLGTKADASGRRRSVIARLIIFVFVDPFPASDRRADWVWFIVDERRLFYYNFR